jgi:hypothetical protein
MSPQRNNIPASPQEIAEAEAWLQNEGRQPSSKRAKHSQAAPRSAAPGRRNLRQRAFAGFSLRNADDLDGGDLSPEILANMTIEKAVPTVAEAGPGEKTVKMSSADNDKAFTRIRNGWRDDLRSESLKQTEERIARGQDPQRFNFQAHAFDKGLESLDIPAPIYQEIRGGYGITQLKGNGSFKGWRRETPWWLPDSVALAKLKLDPNDLDILRYFYLSHMNDEDIYQEMRLVFKIQEPGENATRHTSSGKAVKQRRLKLVKNGNAVLGEKDPSEAREKSCFSDEWRNATELDIPLNTTDGGCTLATITRTREKVQTQPMQEAPGWTQTRNIPPGHYTLGCAVPDCRSFYIYPEPRLADRVYVCRNHPVRMQKKALRDNTPKTNKIQDLQE